MSLLRALKNRNFALLWAANTQSRVGDFVYEIALAWWVLQKTGSAEIMGLVLMASIAPSVLFLLLGGAVVDRFPRLILMIFSDLGCGLAALTLAALGWAGMLELWHIFGAALFFGLATAFFEPAFAAIMPQVVAEKDLGSANALTSISISLGRVLGPALGAGLIAVFGIEAAFALNGISFLLSALVSSPLLRAGIPAPPASEQSSLLADIRQGFSVVAALPWLWINILVFALSNISIGGPYSVAMPFLVGEEVQGGVDRLGLIYAFFPLGYLIAALWLGRYARLPRRGLLVQAGLGVGGLMLLLFGFNLPLWALLLAALVNGFAMQAGQLAWTHLLQEKIPNEQLGRVSSIDQTGSFILMPVGLVVAGWATEVLGPALVFILGGGFSILMAISALLHPTVRRLD
jgi:DHA3 family tetracycline resistance protein-like MFS transporter